MASNISQDGTMKLNLQVIFTSATEKNVIHYQPRNTRWLSCFIFKNLLLSESLQPALMRLITT